MRVVIPPIKIFLDPEERDTLKKAYSIIDEVCNKVEDYCKLEGAETEVSHENLYELLHLLELIL